MYWVASIFISQSWCIQVSASHSQSLLIMSMSVGMFSGQTPWHSPLAWLPPHLPPTFGAGHFQNRSPVVSIFGVGHFKNHSLVISPIVFCRGRTWRAVTQNHPWDQVWEVSLTQLLLQLLLYICHWPVLCICNWRCTCICAFHLICDQNQTYLNCIQIRRRLNFHFFVFENIHPVHLCLLCQSEHS